MFYNHDVFYDNASYQARMENEERAAERRAEVRKQAEQAALQTIEQLNRSTLFTRMELQKYLTEGWFIVAFSSDDDIVAPCWVGEVGRCFYRNPEATHGSKRCTSLEDISWMRPTTLPQNLTTVNYLLLSSEFDYEMEQNRDAGGALVPSRDFNRDIKAVVLGFRKFTAHGKLPSAVLKKLSDHTDIDWEITEQDINAVVGEESKESSEPQTLFENDG